MLNAVVPQHLGRVRSRKLLRNQNWWILRYRVFCISRQGGLTVYHLPTWKDFGQILNFGKSIMTTLRYQVSLKAENYQLNYSQRLDGMIRVALTHFTVILNHRSSSKAFKQCQGLQCSDPKQNFALLELKNKSYQACYRASFTCMVFLVIMPLLQVKLMTTSSLALILAYSPFFFFFCTFSI